MDKLINWKNPITNNNLPIITKNFDGNSVGSLGDTAAADVNINLYMKLCCLLGRRNSSPRNVSSVTRGENEQDMEIGCRQQVFHPLPSVFYVKTLSQNPAEHKSSVTGYPPKVAPQLARPWNAGCVRVK
jgi:hypothetical protein